MHLNFKLEYEDYLQAQKLHMKMKQHGSILIPIMIGLTFIWFIFAYMIRGDNFSLGVILLVEVAVGLYLFYRYLYLPWSLRRQYNQQKSLQLACSYELVEDGIRVSNEFGNYLTPWDHFRKYREDKKLMMLYKTDLVFMLFPKRVFEDPTQLDEFRRMLVEKNIQPK